jgi:PIN domain nuclease of toxin-antitoxin system
MSAVLDTHAAIWYLLDTKNLSERVFSLIDGAAASGTRHGDLHFCGLTR